MLTESADTFIAIHEEVFEGKFLKPHLSFILDLSVQKAMERIMSRGEGFDHFAKQEKLEKIRVNYLELSRTLPDIIVMSAELKPKEIARTIWFYIQPLL
ncbi:MAG: hypothetical protein COU07_01475 [Candidatus Harrisonbacteria bacterium CG10_big_fil_rev_8_21_14_0_10_40_38]|uniref:Thymidylate kinase-like domain-containing protein n=1 Tax=Candidatus Harrisonbacteria bacterium CG10_big_fil_rev_8_21_14_0_10_40_38 TaxID=1974583 RepID=A0A2H0USZ6_9BACT|nr:MAG: hypothetical protein COU07_01475 [Candidatus Harrisonbacteria bacterium CG10_big_fil_rev_8_21_14_0_10_40_38]